MYQVGGDPTQIMMDMNLQALDNNDALEEIIKKVIADNPEQVTEFRNGKDSLMNFLVGKVMATSGGKANPKTLPETIEKIIKA